MVVGEVLMHRRWFGWIFWSHGFRWLGLAWLVFLQVQSVPGQDTEWLGGIPVTASGEEALSPVVIPLGEATVCVLWSQFDEDRYRLFSRRWVEGSWEPSVFIENGSGDSLYPKAFLSNGVIHVAWVVTYGYQLGRMWVTRSLDGGISWESAQVISEGFSGVGQGTISASGQAIHMVWSEVHSGAQEIVYSRSLDGGVSWSSPSTLMSSEMSCKDPWVCVNGVYVSVIWEDWRNGVPEVYFRRSTDSGVTWTKEFSLSLVDKYASEAPRIAVSGTVLQAVWSEDTSEGAAVVYVKSINNGSSWTRKQLISPQSTSPEPTLAVSGKNVLVTFQREVDGTGEIFLTESRDTGTTWSTPVTATAVDGSRSMLPSPAWRTDSAFLGWMSLQGTTLRVWLARNPPLPALLIARWKDY